MTDRVWDRFLSDRDREIYENSGYGRRGGFGKRPALFIIDVQYNFCGDSPEETEAEGMRKYRTYCPTGWPAVPHIERLMHRAREKNIPIFYTQSERRPDMLDNGIQSDKSTRSGERTAIAGTHATSTVAQLAPRPQDILLSKTKPSAFFGTMAMSHLNFFDVDTLILTGCSTSGCLRSTAVDAFSYNFKVAIPEEACFDRFEASHAMGLFDLNAKYADVLPTDEVDRYLTSI